MIRQITPEIAKIFTPEERILYRAGLMDETRRWSQEAQDLAMYLFLDGKKKESPKKTKEEPAEVESSEEESEEEAEEKKPKKKKKSK